jgi:hypothetical protein
MNPEPVEYQNAAEMVNNYRRIRDRMFSHVDFVVSPPPRPALKPTPKLQWFTPRIEPTQWQDAQSLHGLMREVAARHGMEVRVITGPMRTWPVVRARHEFFYLAASQTTHSICAVARRCNRDHSTVRSGILRYCQLNGLPVPRGIGPRPSRLS